MNFAGILARGMFLMQCAHYVYIECMRGVFMVDARVELNKYSNRVLSVVKAKYDLKDKSQAINKIF